MPTSYFYSPFFVDSFLCRYVNIFCSVLHTSGMAMTLFIYTADRLHGFLMEVWNNLRKTFSMVVYAITLGAQEFNTDCRQSSIQLVFT